MDKALNIENIKSAMDKAGLSQSSIATKLDVTREAVSKWIKGASFPRPDKLLRLALLLNLKHTDLTVKLESEFEPVIAFRKKGNVKTTELHISRAQDMGRMLSCLVPHLPFDLLVQPATLKNPSTDYDYMQGVVSKIRTDIGLGNEDELDFPRLIKKFNDLQAVIVPVLWGRKKVHENALHIYLPETMTTWVYLNLDVEVHDFKFWMAHELGHVYSPGLRGDEAEDFADAFAGALLFPEAIAAKAYKDCMRMNTEKTVINKIEDYAERYLISLVSIYYEINKYAKNNDLEEIKLGNYLFARNTLFNKKHQTIDQNIFDDERPDAKSYIHSCKEIFGTPFFDALKSYLAENRKSAGFVQSILDTPLIDAKGIHAELS